MDPFATKTCLMMKGGDVCAWMHNNNFNSLYTYSSVRYFFYNGKCGGSNIDCGINVFNSTSKKESINPFVKTRVTKTRVIFFFFIVKETASIVEGGVYMLVTLAVIGLIIGSALTAVCLPILQAWVNNKLSK